MFNESSTVEQMIIDTAEGGMQADLGPGCWHYVIGSDIPRQSVEVMVEVGVIDGGEVAAGGDGPATMPAGEVQELAARPRARR